MPSVIIASVPIHGHVTPLLGLARKLVERGDDVRFLTGARFADVVTATGARHVALPPDADFDDRDIEKRFPERGRLSPGKALAFDIEHLFAAPGESQYAAVRELLHERSADAIVVDPTFAAGSLLAGLPSQDRPALVVVGVVPLALPGPDLAPFGMGLAPAGGPLGHLRNRILQAIADRTVLAGAQAAGRRMHERALGSPIEWPVLAWADHADAILQLSVASFEYPRPATRTELTFLGPVASSSGTQYPLPEWWADLDGSRPVVHVTQGTNANSDPTSLIRPTIEAFADGSALVVVATGGLPIADLGSLPSYVRAAEFLPYDELFARTDVFVTNGGYGGVQFSLRQGIPLVVAPGKEDKVEVAARVEWSGSGINLRRERPRAAQLRRAVERVLHDGAYRARAKTIAAEIAAAPGADGFPALLDVLIAHHRGATSDRGEPDFLRGVA